MGKELIYFDIFLPYSARPRQHSHPFHEIFFNYEAGGEQLVDARRWSMKAHELYFFPAGQMHMGNGEFHGGVIHLGTELFSSFEAGENEAAAVVGLLCKQAASGHFQVPLSERGHRRVTSIFRRLLREFYRGGTGTELVWRILTLELLLAVLRDLPPERLRPLELPSLTAAERIHHACVFLHENFQRALSVKSAAQIAGMSKSHFQAVFRQVTGATFTEYVNTLRCKQALALLKRGTAVDETAFAVGFSSVSNFYRAFRSVTGRAPRDFRDG